MGRYYNPCFSFFQIVKATSKIETTCTWGYDLLFFWSLKRIFLLLFEVLLVLKYHSCQIKITLKCRRGRDRLVLNLILSYTIS